MFDYSTINNKANLNTALNLTTHPTESACLRPRQFLSSPTQTIYTRNYYDLYYIQTILIIKKIQCKSPFNFQTTIYHRLYRVGIKIVFFF
uniref:Uncharacterized protein n=1 Tax=Pararge aegeria TaxID=116150 RepID=S4P7Y5_9NEOP